MFRFLAILAICTVSLVSCTPSSFVCPQGQEKDYFGNCMFMDRQPNGNDPYDVGAPLDFSVPAPEVIK